MPFNWQKLNWLTSPWQICKSKNYMALFSIIDLGSSDFENLCKKASLKKLSTLSRVAPYVDLPQKKILFKAPFFSHSLATATFLWFRCAIGEYSVTK